jgi:hypothetical protein
MRHTPPKIAEMRNVSQVSGLARAIGRDRFLCKSVKPAGRRISLDCRVEAISCENFEPRTKAGQLLRSQLLDGFFNFFSGCHCPNITFASATEKARRG